jgi:hypothetical protein
MVRCAPQLKASSSRGEGDANLSNSRKGDEKMPETVTQNGTEQLPVAVPNGYASIPNLGPVFTTERMKELVAALKEPFDPTEIKWRVTNTTQGCAPSADSSPEWMAAFGPPPGQPRSTI